MLYLFLVGFAFAQEASQTPAQTQETNNQEIVQVSEPDKTDEIFTVYQVTNDSLNRLIYVLTFITSVLMLFFFIGTATFLYRQYEKDKETRRNAIALEKETRRNAIAFEKNLELSRKNIKIREREAEKNSKEIEKILKTIVSKKPKTGKELKGAQDLLKKLKKEIQDLRGEVNFQKGKVSTVSGLGSTASTLTLGPDILATSYPSASDAFQAGTYSADSRVVSSTSFGSKTCPKCSHINEQGANFCSSCGKSF